MQLRLWGLLVTGPPPISQNRILCVMQKALWFEFWPFDFLVHEFPKRHVSVPSASQWLREAVDLSVHLSIHGAAQAAGWLRDRLGQHPRSPQSSVSSPGSVGWARIQGRSRFWIHDSLREYTLCPASFTKGHKSDTHQRAASNIPLRGSSVPG